MQKVSFPKIFLNRKKFGNRLLISYFSIILLTAILISSSSYIINQMIFKPLLFNYSQAICEQISSNFSSRIQEAEETSFVQYQSIQAFTFLPGTDGQVSVTAQLQYHAAVNEILYLKPWYRGVVFIASDNTPYRAGHDARSLEALSAAFSTEEIRSLWGKCAWKGLENGNLVLARALYHLESGSYIGCLFLEIEKSYFDAIYQSSIEPYHGTVIILDAAQRPLLYTSEQDVTIARDALEAGSKIATVTYDNAEYITAHAVSPDQKWHIVHYVSSPELLRGLYLVGFWIICASLFVILFTCLVASRISKSQSRQIQDLLHRIQCVSEGNFTNLPPNESYSDDEFGLITQNFTQMTQRIDRLMHQVAEEQQKRQQAKYQLLQFRYDALQARINPHFLYNVLESISSIAKLNDQYEMSDWICLLSDMLRESIGRKERMIPLREEISYLKKYTTLYERMYQERVSFQYLIPDDLGDILVPTFLLQPVVENAIVHGIEKSSRKGLVTIQADLRDSILMLTVTDNGIGMSPEQLHQVLSDSPPPDPNSEKTDFDRHVKVGLVSVRQRLRLLYGDNGICRIESSFQKGTRVALQFSAQPPSEHLTTDPAKGL